jgi:hypothetical protein
LEEDGSETIETPKVSSRRESQRLTPRERPRRTVEKKAVVRIWETICQHLGSAGCPSSFNVCRGGKSHLQLVQDLKLHRVQIPQRHVLARIHQRVDRPVYLLKQYRRGRLRRECARDLVDGERQGDGQLDDLVEQHRRAGEEPVVARGLLYPRGMHDLGRDRLLVEGTSYWVDSSRGSGRRRLTRMRMEFWKVNCSTTELASWPRNWDPMSALQACPYRHQRKLLHRQPEHRRARRRGHRDVVIALATKMQSARLLGNSKIAARRASVRRVAWNQSKRSVVESQKMLRGRVAARPAKPSRKPDVTRKKKLGCTSGRVTFRCDRNRRSPDQLRTVCSTDPKPASQNEKCELQ